MPGSNYTFLADISHEGHIYPAVYKPSKGEQPLWDFPDNSLSHREVAAYLVSQALNWRFVPFTIYRDDGPFGPGSLQRYVAWMLGSALVLSAPIILAAYAGRDAWWGWLVPALATIWAVAIGGATLAWVGRRLAGAEPELLEILSPRAMT